MLKSGKDQSLMRFHPWVFSGAMKKIYGEAGEGDWVEVYNNKDEFLASGHYQNSSIAVRILSFEKERTPEEIYSSQVRQAVELRRQAGLLSAKDTNVFRLINAEGDGLPGLIVDHYAGTLVMQMHSAGMYRDIDLILKNLVEIPGLEVRAVYNKSEGTIPFKSGTDIKDGFIFGDATDSIGMENGNRFRIDFREGQKTGFFIDQREHRKLLGTYSKGRKVLNMFGYTGGFSVYALKGEADLVHTVDASARAVDLSRENMELNFPGTALHQAFAMDASDFLSNPPDKYDLIILDPPAFA
ncbi:MAG: class I SAM-dependent rRNA methyltransferase, partial [Bacteroidales bacterium]|nr:class I SAM-dependent rRNA methyltransferase [Bacteroidales bacterium]